MKTILSRVIIAAFLLCGLLCNGSSQTQKWITYLELTPKAHDCFQNRDFENCEIICTQMYNLYGTFPDPLDKYIFAISLVYNKKYEESIPWLRECITSHWFHRQIVIRDIPFDSILIKLEHTTFFYLIDSLSNATAKKCIPFEDTLKLMGDQEQEIRKQYTSTKGKSIKKDSLRREMQLIDSINLDYLKEAIQRYGFPTWSLVGYQGAYNAWLIAQHQPLDFQIWYLSLLERAVAEKNASPSCLAYLEDRVKIKQKIPQCYGTQMWSGGTYQPIEDAEHLNMNREMMLLPPLDISKMKIEKEF
jgi:hypothetical protein